MAAPHVAGVVALLISAHRKSFFKLQNSGEYSSMNYETVYKILTESARRDGLEDPDGMGGIPWPGWGRPARKMCDLKPHTIFPNNFYGY